MEKVLTKESLESYLSEKFPGAKNFSWKEHTVLFECEETLNSCKENPMKDKDVVQVDVTSNPLNNGVILNKIIMDNVFLQGRLSELQATIRTLLLRI